MGDPNADSNPDLKHPVVFFTMRPHLGCVFGGGGRHVNHIPVLAFMLVLIHK